LAVSELLDALGISVNWEGESLYLLMVTPFPDSRRVAG
jgi:hypothetical protein